MKFGKRLEREAVEGWRYIDYSGLKNELKDMVTRNTPQQQRQGSVEEGEGGTLKRNESIGGRKRKRFAQYVAEEIQSVEKFLVEKVDHAAEQLNKLQHDIYVVEGWIDSEYSDTSDYLDKIQQGLSDLGVEVAKLLQYLELNVTATRKILKKYDHMTGHHAGPQLLAGYEGVSLERMSDPYELSEMVIAIQQSLEKVRLLRSRLLQRKDSRRELRVPSSVQEPIPSPPTAGGSTVSFTDSDDNLNVTTIGISAATIATRKSQKETTNAYGRPSNSMADAKMQRKPLSFEAFLARQLLISQALHKPLIDIADLQFARTSRRLRHLEQERKKKAARRVGGLGIGGAMETEGLLTDEEGEGSSGNLERKRPWFSAGLLDEDRTGIVFHVFVMMCLTCAYNANVGVYAPFNIYYAEIAKMPISTSAICYGMTYFTAWASIFSMVDMSKKGLFIPFVIVGCSLLMANLLYTNLFYSYYQRAVNPQQDGTTPYKLDEHLDLSLLGSFAFLGVGGIFSIIMPAFICLRPKVVRTRRSETVAACMVLTGYIGTLLGRGLSTSFTSFDLNHDTLLLNGLTLPSIVFMVVWLFGLVVIGAPTALGAFCTSFFCSEDKSGKEDEDHGVNTSIGNNNNDESSWKQSYTARHYSSLSAYEQKQRQQQELQGDNMDDGQLTSWFTYLMLQGASLFGETMVLTLLIFNLQIVFSETWSVISMLILVWAFASIPLLYMTYLLVTRYGVYLILRASVVLAACATCFLIPMNILGPSYTFFRFVSLCFLINSFSLVAQTVSSVAICKTFERKPHDGPLVDTYGLLGPLLSVQAARYVGQLLVFSVFTFVVQMSADDPRYLLNVCFGTVALAYGVCFLLISCGGNA